MKRICVIAILAASPATAGSFNPALEDPTVIAPECVWFGFIPCHTGFAYVEPEGGETPTPSDALSDWMKGENQKPKSDNSDANGKGGNAHDRDDKDSDAQETAEEKK